MLTPYIVDIGNNAIGEWRSKMGLQRKVTFDYRPNSTQASSNNTPYQCVKVINSLEFNPGDWYKGEVVQAHCNSPKWEVTIIGNG